MNRPAILGGPPAFADPLPFARPSVPALDKVTARLSASWDRGMLTNGPLVRQLEEEAAHRLGVDHVVAVSCCTAGLMLTLRCLEVRGPVVLPSFTFSASGHAVRWNGLVPVFAECGPASYQLDVADAKGRIGGAGALMATHVFGAPCDADAVVALADAHGVPAIFDAAHGFGATAAGRSVGTFGTAEVFSMSPTKVLLAGEGGLVATGDDGLAAALRIGRDYGNPGNYDTQFVGLNARMSELHAAVALESLAELDEHLAVRRARARRYDQGLASVPGVTAQEIGPDDESTWKDYSVGIDPDRFGADRDVLKAALEAEGVDTRLYFFPPVHRQTAYADLAPADLPVTDRASSRVISLPMFKALGDDAVDVVVDAVARIQAHADAVTAAVTALPG